MVKKRHTYGFVWKREEGRSCEDQFIEKGKGIDVKPYRYGVGGKE
jgi:hypothetical protein